MGYCFSIYLIVTVPMHLILGVVGTVIGLVLGFIRPTLRKPTIRVSWIFNVSLLMSGFLFNIIWSMLIFDRLYSSWDYSGVDCGPFGLNIEFGQYFYGMTERIIRMLWLVYAALSWTSAIWITRVVMKRSGQ